MAALTSTPTPVQHIQNKRFSTKQHGYRLWDISLSLSGNIAVSGHHYNSRQTFIDLYFRRNSDSRDKLKLFYSKEYEKYSDYYFRYVSFLGKNGNELLATCIHDKIEIIDTKNESKVLRSCRVKGDTRCLAVSEGEIFIGLGGSQTVIVFNSDLKETKKIKLKGVKDGDYPWDLQVIKDTLFVSTDDGRVLSIAESNGSIITEYTDTTACIGQYSYAYSITVSERLRLVAVVWGGDRIIVYSLNENKSFLVFDVDSDDVYRIRISDRDRMLITGNQTTGEIKMYDLDQLFSFEAMKRTLTYIVSPDECEELRKYFGITEKELRKRGVGDESKKASEKDKKMERMECLLTIIEEKGHLNPYNINNLTDAVSSLGDEKHASNLKGPIEGYELHGTYFRLNLKYKDLKVEMSASQKAWEDERTHLITKLEAANNKAEEQEKTLDDLQGELVRGKEQSEEQEKTLREDLKDAEEKIEELQGKKTALTHELKQSQHSLDINITELTTIIEELTKARAESTSEIETLSEQLKKTNKSLDLSRTESTRKIATLTDKITKIKTESTKDIETLTEELEQTRKKSAKEIETLTEELTQNKESKTEYVRQVETMTEELTHMKRRSTKTIERLTAELGQTKQYLDLAKKESTNMIETLTAELNETKQKLVTRIKELETANKDMEVTKQVLQETKHDRDITRTELKQYQLDFAKESEALKEVLNQTKEAMAELQKRVMEEKHSVDSGETRDEGVTILAAEFGRLIVGIADSLTLDQSLQLAMLFNLPLSVSDALCRVSLFQSPGMKFLEEIRNRNIINMYDVINLQKAFAVLKLENIKQTLLEPYQESVEDELHELHRAEEMLTWEDVEALMAKNDKTAVFQLEDSKTPPQKGAVEGRLDESSQAEAMTQHSETRVPSQRGGHQHPAYIEYNIGREGGIMHLAGASLTIPSDALLESHVIGFTVTNELPFPLPREVDNARMRPLIKLEPLGLMFKKPLQLTIPHSALIPEPENHDIIIFSGQKSTRTDGFPDNITWTEERSLLRQLKEKTVTLNIQCLSYLSASLMSQSSEPYFYLVRAVPFVDGVKNDDDDIILTVCFCGDNESEYSMLLSDYQTKLPLDQYSTLHVCRCSRTDDKDKDEVSLTISSLNNNYMLDMQQDIVKDIAVSHLFAASRVSHQFRLKKNRQIDGDFVDLVLTISQSGNKLTEIFLKTRIKDLMISQKSEDLLLGSVPPALKPYEDLKSNISSMLEQLHCRQLAAYFELSPSETERVENNAAPGRMLIKILDEREKIMPQKMIDLFQGLKACHLDKIARLVSEYIDVNSKQTQETQKREKEKNSTVLSLISEDVPTPQQLSKKKRVKIRTLSSQNDQSVQTILSSSCVTCDLHVKTLTNEGYAEQEVVEALDMAKNRVHVARGILEYIGDQRVSLPKGNIFLYKEQYIDENGGEILLREADIHMLIPVGAVSKGSIVSITMMTSKHVTVPSEGRTPQLTPVIKCGQEGMTLNKPVTLKIPHCASETEGITSTDMYFGFSNKGEEIQWRKRRQHEPSPLLKKDNFEVFLQTFCTISFNVVADYQKRLEKRLRVLPLINRIVNRSDDLTVTLWIYNDDKTEHMHLLHEEITIGSKIQLHDFKRFILKGSRNNKEVHIKCGNNKIVPYLNANIENFTPTILWHNTRQRAEFHFQNKEGIGDITFRLRLYTKQFLRTSDDLQFDLKVALSELLQEPRESTRAVIKIQEPQPAMEKSFQELIRKLSRELDVDFCLEIAGIFGLSSNFRDRLKESSEPGDVLFDKLIHEQLISAASVSVLDVALTRTGNVKLAEDVKEYRRRNATFPTTIFTLL